MNKIVNINHKDELDAKMANATPMMRQYHNIKANYPDCLLFYRMGDFYELFFEDAVIAAKTLDITLTKRGKHGDEDIAMCGVPHHSHEQYLQRLIKAGYKVAICEQMEPPEEAKKRGYKAVVKRDVVRIVTKGTIFEDQLLDPKLSNYLAVLVVEANEATIAWLDMLVGKFYIQSTDKEAIASVIARIAPKEILFSEKLLGNQDITASLQEYKDILTPHVNNFFEHARAQNNLKQFYELHDLQLLSAFSNNEIRAAGAMIEYLSVTQKASMPRIDFPSKVFDYNYMSIDSSSLRNLEVFETLSGERKGSLFGVINNTVTSSGSRLLAQYIAMPLVDKDVICSRQEVVSWFLDNIDFANNVRDIISNFPDAERAIGRICMGKAIPKDLLKIRDAIRIINSINENVNSTGISKLAVFFSDSFNGYADLLKELESALSSDVSLFAKEYGFIASSYDENLDNLRNAKDNIDSKIEELKEKYRSETGISNLKINNNNILGYYVEVTAQHSAKMNSETFIHRQGLANAMRYTTEELLSLERVVLSAETEAVRVEKQIYQKLLGFIIEYAEELLVSIESLAALDVLSSFAVLAAEQNFVRPIMSNSNVFKVKKARHPVVEYYMKNEPGKEFVANDCVLGGFERMWLITGPNMAGKSTFLRQNAIIVILAQIGCYVPCEEAEIGIVDKLFCRVGASDDLAKGRSTFMVEMSETAMILNQATEKSLVILDEIGRGTATYDGLSIAWAVAEFLHDINQSRTLFATHYHELVSLKHKLKSFACYNMKVEEFNKKVVFLHEIVKGAADRSYGIYVAKIAGLPRHVISRAESILVMLEESERNNVVAKLIDDLPLFANNSNDNSSSNDKAAIITALEEINIDNLTPKDALDVLYNLKQQFCGN